MTEGRQTTASAPADFAASTGHDRAADIAALTIGGAGLAVSLAMLLVWWEALRGVPPANSDFVSYYIGSALFGTGQSPYDRSAELALRASLTGLPAAPADMLYFLYPPVFLVVMLPLAALGLQEASLIWGLFQLGALVGTCWVLYRHLPSWRWGAVLCWLPFWLPVAAALKFGQVSVFLSLGLVLFATAASGTKPWSGVATWLLLPKPQLILLPAFVLLIGRRWRPLLLLAVGCVGSVVASVALVGVDGIAAYLASISWAGDQMALNLMWRASTYSWEALLVSTSEWERPLLVVSDGLTAVVWLALWRRWGLKEAAGAVGFAGVLVSPHAMIYDLCLWLAALPAITRRRARTAVPLLVGSLATPWLANGLLGQTWPAVLWAALSLVVLLLTKPRPSGGPAAEVNSVPTVTGFCGCPGGQQS
ncbi:MAG: DUF2029 domain-containing protein [Chloroflexi bacterium]|nr:DUF2029 domain-containing protein [Chloroflexota bacterium]MCL5110929.1 DUF2029 domain-containing protein [Chloroflexota bacterium]